MMTYEHCNNYDEQVVVGEEQNDEEKQNRKRPFLLYLEQLFL